MRLKTLILTVLAATLLATAYAEETPKRSPELQVLDQFVGTWDIDVTIAPAGGDAVTEITVETRAWSRGGRYVLFDKSGAQEFHMALTYDGASKTYPAVFIGEGFRGLLAGTWDAPSATMRFEGTYADGNKYSGKHVFLGNSRAKASGTVTNPDGDVLLKLSWQQRRRGRTAMARSPSTDPKAEQIIAKHLQAIGGIEAHTKLKTRKMEGTLSMTGIDTPWKLTTIQKAPDKKHNRVEIPNIGVSIDAVDGKVAWRRDPQQKARRLAGHELNEKLRDARFYGGIEVLTEGNLTYAGTEEVNGKTCHVLKGTYDKNSVWGDGTYFFYIDEKTHLMNRIKWPSKSLEGVDYLGIDMSDYKAVDGIQVPFSMTITLGAEPFLSIKFDAVKHGIKVDDAVFAMPESGGESAARPTSPTENASDSVTAEQIVNSMDANRDGKINKDEASEDLRLFFDEYDVNEDGAIDLKESQALAKYVNREQGRSSESTPNRVTAKQIVSYLDKNDDGKISKDEASPELKPHFEKIDTNGDGAIDEKEAEVMADYVNQQQGK